MYHFALVIAFIFAALQFVVNTCEICAEKNHPVIRLAGLCSLPVIVFTAYVLYQAW